MKCRPGFDGGLDQSFLLEVEEVPFYLFVPFYLVVPLYEDDDNDHDLDKNSHILPTGQWYAPSAVINDVLIMPEYARACQSMPEYARVCKSMPEYAKVCQSMQEYAKVCQSMQEYAR